MTKTKTRYVCQTCGDDYPKWMGRCPNCGEWNTLVETLVTSPPPTSEATAARQQILGGRSVPVALPDIPADSYQRLQISLGEFNRVLGGGLVPGSLILIGGDPGIGKCVIGDTRVFNPLTGDYLPITTPTNTVLAVDETTLKLAPVQVTAFHAQGLKPIVEIKTKLGRTIRCTHNHPFLTVEGWQQANQLKTGSYVASPRSLPYFGHEPLPAEQVKLMAYILSDGSATSSTTVTTMLPQVVEDLEEIAAAFGMRLSSYDKAKTKARMYRFVNFQEQRAQARQEVATALKKVQQQTGITWAEWARQAKVNYSMLNVWRRGQCVPNQSELESLAQAVQMPLLDFAPQARHQAEITTPIAQFLEMVGLRFSTAATKAVPESVFRLPKAQLALFLKVLFTGDGSVYVNQYGLPGVSYSTISLRLAQDVQHLLLRFGLVATLRTKPMRVNQLPYTAYELVLLGVPYIKKFLAEIGIIGREEAIAKIKQMPMPTLPSTQRDVIPPGEIFWQHLKTVTQGLNFREISRQADTMIRDRRHERPLCRSTIAKLAEAFPDERLQALAHGEVYWDEIVNITEAGEAEVYDLSVPTKANFVANDLIIHNSTLLLQASASLAANGQVLYISGEESAQQLKLRANRLNIAGDNLLVLTETNMNIILEHVQQTKPKFLVIDSIQTVYLDEYHSAAGSVSQVRECAARLQEVAKRQQIATFLIGHVTKTGSIAGPRVLEHIVDTVLYLEGERFHTYRLLRSVKNRFGATNEIGVFEMSDAGLSEVLNPSEALLAERLPYATGSAIAVTMEGTRPLLVEIQALSSTTTFGNPRRTANGVDFNRLLLIIAVLTKRVGLQMADQDVFVNVVGGLQIDEPASDLAVAAALTSGFRNRPVAADIALVGEVGLSGELRAVGHLETRVKEAAKLGFKRCVMPASNQLKQLKAIPIELLPVRSLSEALEKVLVV